MEVKEILPLTASRKPYVYSLSYPDGRVFYIGKGIGKRILEHERDVRDGKSVNTLKVGAIKSIWASGDEVLRDILSFFETDEDAFMYEQALIFLMGEHLTNIAPCQKRKHRPVFYPASMSEKTLTVNEAAKRLGVHPNTVRNGIDTGRIKAVKVLGRWRIQESEVERILRGGSLEGGDQEQH